MDFLFNFVFGDGDSVFFGDLMVGVLICEARRSPLAVTWLLDAASLMDPNDRACNRILIH